MEKINTCWYLLQLFACTRILHLIKRSVAFFAFIILNNCLNHGSKQNAILRWHYHSILVASWEKNIFSYWVASQKLVVLAG